jgi:predicted transposase YbfD/YdcC
MSASVPDARPALLHSFDDLSDPRVAARCAYPLQELLLVALCAVTCDADDWVHVAEWGQAKLDWLRRFLPFEAGVASHDTFSRVFAQLDSQRFEACFRAWMSQLCPSLEGHNIAVDGKSVRGSHEAGAGMAHMVSAWHTGAGLTLGQVRTAAKSNEITAIPVLLEALDIRGATITMDAMGCQREIVQDIVAREAHYLIGVKNNQPTLAQAVETLFEPALREPHQTTLDQDVRIDKSHARLQRRRCVVHTDLSSLGALHELWPGLKCVAMVASTREVIQGRDRAPPSTEWRYYISSKVLDAAEFSRQIQAHWQIENSCHWVLDVSYDEDASRVRRDHGAQNLALLRRMSLNLIKQDKSKGSIGLKRKRAGWNDEFMAQLLGRTQPAHNGPSPAPPVARNWWGG